MTNRELEEFIKYMDEFTASLDTPEKALAYLIESGLLGPNGECTSRYYTPLQILEDFLVHPEHYQKGFYVSFNDDI